ncbi:hypothetical protein ACIG47_17845 [Promicromonospora sp. NPDC052451]|uniref:hypothetical protein n=1 Tax=unclassified Promicromonospora TaxID=2647929 RepID=UPI0037CC9D0E
MRKVTATLLSALAMLPALAVPAAAYPPVDIVHTEQVEAGPYDLTVGFSTWPLRAMQSLDFSFAPAGGLQGMSGELTVIDPDGAAETEPLARHPRDQDLWGLDVESLNAPGDWTFRFTVDGPQGPATGELTGLEVLEQPGPPLGLSWSVSTLPLLGLVALVVVAWRRTRPGARQGDTPATEAASARDAQP